MKYIYTDAFLACWRLYPHFPNRSSKIESFKVWGKRRLEEQSESVLAWINAALPDWNREHRQYVPAMERWLRRTDFDDPAPILARHGEAVVLLVQCPRCRGELVQGACTWCGWPRILDQSVIDS